MATRLLPDIAGTELRAHQRAHDCEFPVLVENLVDLLGAQLVAIIGGVSDLRRVKDWKAGDREPRDPNAKSALRLGFQVGLMLTEGGRSNRVAQAWFQGANPILGYKAPAMVLRTGPPDKAGPAVVEAARVFIAE